MSPIIDEVVQFCKNALSSGILGRDDYKDCAETVLLVLGHPPDNYTFKSPIGISKTRWMAKIVYGLKIFLFRDALKLPGDEKNKFERFIIFICLYYVKHWITAPVASDAPLNDLTLFKDMLDYEQYDSDVSAAVIEKLRLHTWFLNQEFTPLNLFSSRVDDEVKSKIVEKLLMVKSKLPKEYGTGIFHVLCFFITFHIYKASFLFVK